MNEITTPAELAAEAATRIAELSGVPHHDIAITVGSGWGEAIEELGEIVAEIPAPELPGFNQSIVHGHRGTLRSVRLASGHHALVIAARTHLYEGHGVEAVVHGVRTAAATGAKVMVLTNGAGSTRLDWTTGTVALISDHINLTGLSPLQGATFVDLTNAYSPRLRALARQVDPTLPSGIYAQFPGPHYETPAEVRMVTVLGADLVGMSTTLETIAAREAGMEVLGLSLVTNPAAGTTKELIDHLALIAESQNNAERISSLLAQVVTHIAEEL